MTIITEGDRAEHVTRQSSLKLELYDIDGAAKIPWDGLRETRLDRVRRHGPRDEHDKRLLAQVERGGVPTFRLGAVAQHLPMSGHGCPTRDSLVWRDDPLLPGEDGVAENVCLYAIAGLPTRTAVWTHDQQLFAVGPHSEWVAELVRPHHRVRQPKSFAIWADFVERRNPWRATDAWDDVVANVKAETSLRIGPTLETMKSLLKWKRPAEWHYLNRTDTRVNNDRATLAEVAQRAVQHEQPSFPFLLQQIAVAELRSLNSESRNECIVTADLGNGHLVTVRIVRFAGEAPQPLRSASRYGGQDPRVIDGGDVRLWLTFHRNDELRHPRRCAGDQFGAT